METKARYRARSGTLKDGTISEKAFSQQVTDFAHLNGWMVYRTWNSIHSPSGFPDLVLVKPPRLVFAELKSVTGRLSSEQMKWFGALLNCAAKNQHQAYFLWRPADWPEIERVLGGADGNE